ncbi:MAG: sigma-70 family RNA polymerase sigma factor [Clostridia bacterium]|nr:sigma-70 family RNA polymerase sigma factor [Clostridia bacterium]
MDYRQNTDRDELRAEFTAWLDTLIRRAKLDYLRKNTIPVDIVSLEDLHEDNYPVVEDEWMNYVLLQDDDFNFEQERLAIAYAQLPLLRKQILKLLFVQGLKVKEIARMLNCSPNFVSDQKRRALEALRRKLAEGGDEDG